MTDRLQAIIAEFQSVPSEFRLELLLDYARRFQQPPPHIDTTAARDLARVHECQAEVYLFPEIQNGCVRLHASIPDHAPTQRALLGLLQDGYDGASVRDIATIPDDLLTRLGIGGLLGIQRQHGFAGVLRHLKARVREASV